MYDECCIFCRYDDQVLTQGIKFYTELLRDEWEWVVQSAILELSSPGIV